MGHQLEMVTLSFIDEKIAQSAIGKTALIIVSFFL